MARTKQTTREYTQIARIERLEQENILLNRKVMELTQKFEESMKFIHTLKVMYEMQHPELQEPSSQQSGTPDLLLETQDDEMNQKLERMHETYDDLDLLSDIEEIYVDNESAIVINPETFELEINDQKTDENEEITIDTIISSSNPTLIIDTDIQNLNLEPPFPENLITSPMPEFIELVVEINYKKMKVGELKKICKERKIKGYSKLKKKQLIELLS